MSKSMDHDLSVDMLTEEQLNNMSPEELDNILIQVQGTVVEDYVYEDPVDNGSEVNLHDMSSTSDNRFDEGALTEQCEVVFIHSSFGSNRTAYFDSIRLRHFLDTKGVLYMSVDVNKEASTGRNVIDDILLEQWLDEGLLLTEDIDPSRAIVPQLLIDGVAVGSYYDVQDLEEDDDFEWSVTLQECPACFHPRALASQHCDACGAIFQRLISDIAVQRGSVLAFRRGTCVNAKERFVKLREKPPSIKDIDF